MIIGGKYDTPEIELRRKKKWRNPWKYRKARGVVKLPAGRGDELGWVRGDSPSIRPGWFPCWTCRGTAGEDVDRVRLKIGQREVGCQ